MYNTKGVSDLTHWGRNKMATTLADDVYTTISLNCVPNGPIDNTSSLVQVMAWRRKGDKSLHEPMMTQFNDTFASPGLRALINIFKKAQTQEIQMHLPYLYQALSIYQSRIQAMQTCYNNACLVEYTIPPWYLRFWINISCVVFQFKLKSGLDHFPCKLILN